MNASYTTPDIDWMQITDGRIPALPPVTPLPSTRIQIQQEPLGHRWEVPMPPDLTDHVQRLISKYTLDVFMVGSSGCQCDRCVECIKSLLFNLVAECITDQNALLLALTKDRQVLENLTQTLQTYLPLCLRGRERQ